MPPAPDNRSMEKIFAVILAGGTGTRLGGDTPKQFLPLGGKPVIARSLEVCSSLDAITGIIVTAPEEFLDETRRIIEEYGFAKVIAGGATRQGSVWNALTCRGFGDDDIVLVHDAARPFVTAGVIMECVSAVRTHGAAGVYVPSTDTVTEVDEGVVSAVPLRHRFYLTQTPQGFRYAVIRAAHEKARGAGVFDATDDVTLAIDAGYRVKMVEGDRRNIKITTAFDYDIARLLIEPDGDRL